MDKDARLKPRKLHDITQLLTKAFSLLEMTNSPNKPAVIITDSLKMPSLPGVYNYAENVFITWIRAEGKRALEILKQKGYNINKINQYATISKNKGNYDEFYTEYRTLKILLNTKRGKN